MILWVQKYWPGTLFIRLGASASATPGASGVSLSCHATPDATRKSVPRQVPRQVPVKKASGTGFWCHAMPGTASLVFGDGGDPLI